MLRRMQIFVTGFLEQARRHGLPVELIIVEWNPPADHPRLVDALSWSGAGGDRRVRIIEVPAALHARHRYADRLPLFQMIAKNVGLRRARGRFVLCTNIDLLFSDDLMRFLASGRLDARCLYRVDRLDVPADVPPDRPIAEQLAFCRANVLRINTRWGTFEPGQRLAVVLVGRLWRRFWPHGRWAAACLRGRRVTYRLVHLAVFLPRVLLRGIGSAPRPWRDRMRLLALEVAGVAHDVGRWLGHNGRLLRVWLRRSAGRARRLMRRAVVEPFALGLGLWVTACRLPGVFRRLRHVRLRPLHTNGCGDFTLLARPQWHALRGYPELAMFSLHLDSVLCQMAHRAGLREVVLGRGCHIYHIDHDSGWSPQEAARLVDRMKSRGVPVVDRALYDDWVTTMRRQGAPIVFNGEDWGLATEPLREFDPAVRSQDPAVSMSSGRTTVPA